MKLKDYNGIEIQITDTGRFIGILPPNEEGAEPERIQYDKLSDLEARIDALMTKRKRQTFNRVEAIYVNYDGSYAIGSITSTDDRGLPRFNREIMYRWEGLYHYDADKCAHLIELTKQRDALRKRIESEARRLRDTLNPVTKADVVKEAVNG